MARKEETHITGGHKYLKYVFTDEYIKPGNLSLSFQTGQLWPHQSGIDFHIAYSSSRVFPGKPRLDTLWTGPHSKFIIKYHTVGVHLKFTKRYKVFKLSSYADW